MMQQPVDDWVDIPHPMRHTVSQLNHMLLNNGQGMLDEGRVFVEFARGFLGDHMRAVMVYRILRLVDEAHVCYVYVTALPNSDTLIAAMDLQGV